jgi:hypothetical protein
MENFLKIAPVGFETAMQEAIKLPANMQITLMNNGGILTQKTQTKNYTAIIFMSIIFGGVICYIAYYKYQMNKRAITVKQDDAKQ